MVNLAFFKSKRCPDLAPTKKQLGVTARVVAHLKEHGSITALEIQNMGTTDARKLITRLRRRGLITSTLMEANASGVGKHARYYYQQNESQNHDRSE